MIMIIIINDNSNNNHYDFHHTGMCASLWWVRSLLRECSVQAAVLGPPDFVQLAALKAALERLPNAGQEDVACLQKKFDEFNRTRRAALLGEVT